MKKKLVIRFVKFEKALVAQQLAVVGDEHFDETEHVKLDGTFYLCESLLSLINSATDDRVKISALYFSNNTERDKYLNNVVKWITDEQFTGYAGAPQEVGELCTVSDNGKHWRTARVIAILPNKYKGRYIYEDEGVHEGWACATHALSILERVEPKTDGDVYSWEMEVCE